MTRRKGLMWFVVVVATLIVGYTGAYVASPEVRYLHRAGVEESKILASRQDIAKLVADTTVPEETRARLRLVLEARDFAATLGLEANDTYTKYADVGRDTLLLVVTASGADCICPVTWKYPIAGRVPYKGFFDAAEGGKFAGELEGKGYDVNVRPRRRSVPSGGSTTRSSPPRSNATRWSWWRWCCTRSRTTRSG
jgi:predicted aminopeptidase